MLRFTTWAIAGALILGACSTASDGLTVVLSSPGSIGIGPQRILLSVVDEKTQELRLVPQDGAVAVFSQDGKEVGRAPANWVWAIPNVNGFYETKVEFPGTGKWTTHLEFASGPATAETDVPVVPDVSIVEVGDPAPASETPTYPASSFEQITTDTSPDPGFYSMTVAEAVTSGIPSVIVFATPAFCESRMCGPTLDIVKASAPQHPGVNFVHVEIYENLQDPGALVVVPSVTEWGLPSEPWVFVVDGNGVVTARFEGTVAPTELGQALAALGV